MSRVEPTADARRAVAERNIQAILDAAERLLLSGRVVTFSAVAAEAAVSRPTVYAHFADRPQLLGALVERSVEAATMAMTAAEPDTGSAPDALGRLIAVGWEHVARHQAIARAAISELPVDVLHGHHRLAEAVLECLIRRGQDDDDFRQDLPPSWLATSCVAIIHAAAAAVASDQMRPDQAVEILTTTVLDLCASPRSVRRRRPTGKGPRS